MSDLLMSKSCVEFSESVAGRESMPGGGTAGALVGALGAALCSMAANFTIGNKKYAEFNDEAKTILEKSERLRKRLLELADEDAAAFPELSAAYKIPKDNPERDKIYEQAAMNACKAPVEMIKCCAEAIDLLEIIADKGNKMLITDAGGGTLLCKAAMENAALNVFINTSSIKNCEEARKIETQIDVILSEYSKRATNISGRVNKFLRGNDPNAIVRTKSNYETVRSLFKLFATPLYRYFHTTDMNLNSRKIIKAESDDGIFCAQWEYENDTSMKYLNALLEIVSNIPLLKSILGEELQAMTIPPGANNMLVRDDGNYMLITITCENFELPLFNDNVACDDITVSDAKGEINLSGKVAFYGMPVLSGIRVTNPGTMPILIYYIRCTA